MSDISKLNGYNIKDSIARDEIARLDQEKADLQYVEEAIDNLDVSQLMKTDFEPMESDMPRVYFIGNGNFLPTTKDNVVMQMKYASKTATFDCFIKIKCQGTSSMAYDKKNFSITMYEDMECTTKFKYDFRQWGPQSKFCLKANYIDLTHARNVVSARLWGDIVRSRSDFESLPEELKTAPNNGAVDGFFIKVYYEGIYQGLYTFNIPKDPWMTGMEDEHPDHCLLCAENYGSGCFQAPALIDESDWTDEIHDVCPDYILERWNEVIDFVRTSSNVDFVNNLNQYFDVPSLIDYYCFQFLACGLDSMGKNQVYITYDRGQKWYATSYDMDSTWGLYWNGWYIVSPAYRMQQDYESGVNGTINLLYDRLEKLFRQDIYNRYRELRIGPMSVSSIIARFEGFTEVCHKDLIEEEVKLWPNIPGQDVSNIQQIRKFAIERIKYCDDCIQALIEDPITANKLYELPQETVFDGTNHIDTGIKLFDTAKDWTLVVTGHMNDTYQNMNTCILHCMYEGDDGDYPGLSVQSMANGTFPIVGAPGDHFPGHPIDTNTFKFAIRCEKGIVTELRTVRDKGAESYRVSKGRYNQVDKNLILGCYLDEAGNFARNWQGTLYSCELYDQALRGGQIKTLLETIIRAMLREGYNPWGAAWKDETPINWKEKEILVDMNLDTCDSESHCVLSIGQNIDSWAGNNIHFYYNWNTKRLLVQCMVGGAAQNIELQNVTGTLRVKFGINGLTINDTLYPTSEYQAFANIQNLANVQIGSTEGSGRSMASNYNIEIADK